MFLNLITSGSDVYTTHFMFDDSMIADFWNFISAALKYIHERLKTESFNCVKKAVYGVNWMSFVLWGEGGYGGN